MPAGYASSFEHLADELARADQLVRAQTQMWRQAIASTKPDDKWGMAYVDQAEVDRYLTAPFRLAGLDGDPGAGAESAADTLAARHRRAAADRAAEIAARVRATE